MIIQSDHWRASTRMTDADCGQSAGRRLNPLMKSRFLIGQAHICPAFGALTVRANWEKSFPQGADCKTGACSRKVAPPLLSNAKSFKFKAKRLHAWRTHRVANRGQCEMDERHHPQSERAPVVARGGMRRMRANAHRARSFARRKKKKKEAKSKIA